MIVPFVDWFERRLGFAASELQLDHAFVIAVCRIESAAAQNATDPIAAVSNTASPQSRQATKAMLRSLGYSPAQTRIVQRLLGGSPGGWPGLIRLYLDDADLTRGQRVYLNREVRRFRSATDRPADRPVCAR
jgi:hypothetical protein